jgi:hypothetical protein
MSSPFSNSTERGTDATIGWLLNSDPTIRWQVMRDLLGAAEPEYRAERAKVETQGWGARLLSYEDDDGQWAGGSFLPGGFDFQEWQDAGQPWTATAFSLSQLREFGIDPDSDRMKQAVTSIGANSRWDHAGERYWDGEVEECINGRILADGAYFGVDVSHIASRLAGERLDDGGWNCERANGSVRSSFASTINVLEGLLEYERVSGGSPESRQARGTGEEYLLRRSLFRRASTGEPADEQFLSFLHPSRWHYDVLRALDYFRDAATVTGAAPDPRLGEAIDHVRSKRTLDGTWLLDAKLPGRVWFDVDEGAGKPSRWVTLRAMRVLRWWDQQGERLHHPG